MRRFYCGCGQEIFLENNHCTHCGRSLGYDHGSAQMVALEPVGERWQRLSDGMPVRICANRENYGVCNALVAIDDSHALCPTCRLNHTIPDLSRPENLKRWASLEEAKRRLIFGLLALKLPLQAPVAGYPRGLSFDFLEDQRTNPDATEAFVTTGHRDGVITINVLEADDVQRVWQRELSGERYRTLLGHLRHEVGHYYFELLVPERAGFSALFGDPALPYSEALARHYRDGPLAGWEQHYISAYASAHPLEDWAECFAHYLHMVDTLETASARSVIPPLSGNETIEQRLGVWDGLAVTLNELNRSLGLRDAYPFVVTPVVADKLRFIDAAIGLYGR